MWIGRKKHIPTPIPGLSEEYDNKIKEIEESEDELNSYLKKIRGQFNNDERITYSHCKSPFQLDIPVDLIKGQQQPPSFFLTSLT